MKSIAIFCGSSDGYNDLYRTQAYLLGKVLAHRDIRVVYGGARIGLMGAVADGCLVEGGQVTGVLPRFLQTKEIAHTGLTQLLLVETMHERKLLMHEMSDAIIALPGGFGTMEEMFEMITWAQLGMHRKPIGLLNTAGYFNALQVFLSHMVNEGFVSTEHAGLLCFSDDIDDLLMQMADHTLPQLPKWLTESKT
jgi:uncharacterized protein (TIGR00730 family)